MPSYSFVCPNCAYKTEIRLLISERNNDQICPKCKENLQRLIEGGSGIIFKGPGFYATDHPKKSKGEEDGI